jgi:hypothetical protein
MIYSSFQKSIKKYQQSLREVQARLEEETRSKEIAHDALINNERRAHANQVHFNCYEKCRQGWRRRPGPRRMLTTPSSTMRDGLILTRYIQPTATT